MSILSAHGKHKMWVESNVVCIESQGPWNLEYFNEMHLELLEKLYPIREEPYAVYLKLIGNAMPVAEALDVHQKFVATGNSRAVAINLSECLTRPITEKIFTNTYLGVGIKCQVFESKRDAFNWVLPLLNEKA